MDLDNNDFDDLDFLPFETWKESNDKIVSQVATPQQIPTPPSMRHLPKDVLQSHSVQALLNYLDEVQTRLAVSLKQIAQLETQIAAQQAEQNLQSNDYQRFITQKEVLREKEVLYKEVIRKLELQLAEAEDELEESRQLFSELHQKYDRNKKQFIQLQQEMSDTEILTKKQKSRIELKIKSSFKRLYRAKSELYEESLRLKALLKKKETQTEQMRLNLSLTVEQLQNKESEFRENEKTLTFYFESEILQLSQERDRIVSEKEELIKKSVRNENLMLSNIELENKLVLSQRKMEQLAKQNSDEVSKIQEQMMKYRKEAKALFIEKSALAEEFEKMKFENNLLKRDQEALIDRNESLELLLKNKNYEIRAESTSSDSTTEES